MKENINMRTGRPKKFKSVEDLQERIDRYFTDCEENEEPVTVTGLCIWLDTTRDVLMDYQNDDEFSNTIKKAKQRIENAYEKRLIKRGNAGDIFALKQFGWTDKQTIDSNISYSLFEQETERKAEKLAANERHVKKNKK